MRPQPLAQRVLLDQRRQLPDHLLVAPECQICLDTLLDRTEAELFELRDRRLRKRFVGEVRQRRAAPQRQRLSQDSRGHFRRARRERPAPLLDQAAEALDVKLARRDAQQVTASAGYQRPV